VVNVMLVTLDTQRADHLSCYGYCRQTSPTLDALAAEGVLFENCVTHTAHTMPTFTTMMTGQDPGAHGIVGTLFAHPNEPDQRLDDLTPVVAEVLRNHGWHTAAFDNLADFGCHPSWFVRGYHWYVNTWAPAARHPSQVRAAEINERLLPWLQANGTQEPWFLFVHYWDPHQAYNQPEPYRTMHTGGSGPEKVTINGRGYRPGWGWTDRLSEAALGKIDLYDGELSYVDTALGEVFDTLRELGVYENTAIIVTADHGEDLEEHNAPFEHREPYETTVGVPLIFKPPAGLPCPAGRRVTGIVGHVDLLPSILALAEVEGPEGVDGVSWLPMAQGTEDRLHDVLFLTGGALKQHGTWVSPELAVRTETHKYIRRGTATYHEGQTRLDVTCLCAPPWRGEQDKSEEDLVQFFNSLPKRELYDLAADPNETVNRIKEQPAVAAELDQRLREWAARNPARLICD